MLKPWEYYDNNVNGTLVLLDVMRKHGCKKLIFSSSATVYGEPEVLPIADDHPKGINKMYRDALKWEKKESIE